ncbi:Doublecortin domain-containing protein 2C [Thoreauomyces humboldtii]|nr:Doublecortin domain-containing protein 2C [Thoreauomyces humboldtii]
MTLPPPPPQQQRQQPVPHEELRSKRIRVFRNGDSYDAGKKLVINPRVYRNFEQFLARLSRDINLVNGAARRVYSLDGQPIHSLDDLKDGSVYIASGGENLKRIPYLVAGDAKGSIANLDATAPSPTNNSNNNNNGSNRAPRLPHVRASFDRRRQSAWGAGGPTPRFGTSRVLDDKDGNNGNGNRAGGDGERTLFGPTLLRNLTELLRISVRKLYDAETGGRISNLRQVRDNQNMVASASDAFKHVPYLIETSSRAPVVKTEEEVPRVATFFPNGDVLHIGQNVTITKKTFPTLQRLLDHLNTKIHLVTGMIHKIYSLSGRRILAVEDLEQMGGYVVVSNNDPFIKVSYNLNALAPAEAHARGLDGTTQQHKHMKGIRRRRRRHRTKGGETTDGESNLDGGGNETDASVATTRHHDEEDGADGTKMRRRRKLIKPSPVEPKEKKTTSAQGPSHHVGVSASAVTKQPIQQPQRQTLPPSVENELEHDDIQPQYDDAHRRITTKAVPHPQPQPQPRPIVDSDLKSKPTTRPSKEAIEAAHTSPTPHITAHDTITSTIPMAGKPTPRPTDEPIDTGHTYRKVIVTNEEEDAAASGDARFVKGGKKTTVVTGPSESRDEDEVARERDGQFTKGGRKEDRDHDKDKDKDKEREGKEGGGGGFFTKVKKTIHDEEESNDSEARGFFTKGKKPTTTTGRGEPDTETDTNRTTTTTTTTTRRTVASPPPPPPSTDGDDHEVRGFFTKGGTKRSGQKEPTSRSQLQEEGHDDDDDEGGGYYTMTTTTKTNKQRKPVDSTHTTTTNDDEDDHEPSSGPLGGKEGVGFFSRGRKKGGVNRPDSEDQSQPLHQTPQQQGQHDKNAPSLSDANDMYGETGQIRVMQSKQAQMEEEKGGDGKTETTTTNTTTTGEKRSILPGLPRKKAA